METTIKKNFPITGLSCASCAISAERMLKAQAGVLNASVNYANSTASVEYLPGKATIDAFQSAIQAIGYDLLIEDDGQVQQEKET